MNKTYAYGELADGTTWEDVRVTLTDKIAYERTARANHWDYESQQQTAAAFLSWAAAKRTGVNVPGWEEFVATAVDSSVTERDTRTVQESDSGSDPTQTAPSTEPQ
ncbi:hypothetical protein PZ938_07665 [Luteipulveratus sp. YIM 133132]|uniref:hypothetical protein n=1 Tax=Luteipulveratus flavus TaxID=3031728 RepID=UPI0023AEFFE1|nr:hypothetical protein [Luteipulveratus sp. YIM 133132]MDE9365479.1 hypothetical protein [Luteipulveratus sp. YIM 133132]